MLKQFHTIFATAVLMTDAFNAATVQL